MNNTSEIEWREIPDYEGAYSVSNTGLVRSNARAKWNGNGNYLQEKILKHVFNPQGYPTVRLYLKGNFKVFSVHRLVAEAFIPNPDNKPEINHIDNDRKNHAIDNLEWCTHVENMQHAAKQGRMYARYASTELLEQIKKLLEAGLSQNKIARRLNIASETIRKYFPSSGHNRNNTLDPDKVKQIKELLEAGVQRKIIAETLKVSTNVMRKYFPSPFKSNRVAEDKLEQIKALLDEGVSQLEITKRLNVSKGTIRKYFPRH